MLDLWETVVLENTLSQKGNRSLAETWVVETGLGYMEIRSYSATLLFSIDANLSWTTLACMGVDTQGLNPSVVLMALDFHSCSILLSITPGQVQIISTERPRYVSFPKKKVL